MSPSHNAPARSKAGEKPQKKPKAQSQASPPSLATAELYDDVAYCYDGSLEGLLSAIFAAYANREDPSDVAPAHMLQPRLGQHVSVIETDVAAAQRVKRGLSAACGWRAFDAVRKASLSSEPHAGTAAYRFVRYAMDEQKHRDCARCRKRDSCTSAHAKGKSRCPKLRGRALSDVAHPAVGPLFNITRAIDNECEHMRQFIRFEHVGEEGASLWYARCNPRDSVIPLVMSHFVERFNVQPFIIYDENHHLAGVYDTTTWYLVKADEGQLNVPPRTAGEVAMQDAWRRFYRTVSIDARYNPELRRHFMPKRFWKHLTELQDNRPGLTH